MDRYLVTIGSDLFEVEAETNPQAKYKAAELFKEKHSLDIWLTDIVEHAKARLTTPPEPTTSTKKLLKLLTKEGSNVPDKDKAGTSSTKRTA